MLAQTSPTSGGRSVGINVFLNKMPIETMAPLTLRQEDSLKAVFQFEVKRFHKGISCSPFRKFLLAVNRDYFKRTYIIKVPF
jgi:hypothetical protein